MVRTMPSPIHAPRVTALLLAISLSLAPTLALAGDAKVAIKFYEDAQVAYGNGEYDRAAELLFQAYQEDPNLVYQYNRVLALQAAGKLELALDTLNTFYPLMRDDPQKRFEDIADIRTSLEEAIAERKVAKPDPKPDKPGPNTPAPVVTPPPPQVDEGGSDILAWSLIGVGAVALGVGTLYITGAMLPELPCDTSDNACINDPNSDYNARFKERDEARAGQAAIGIGGLVVGAALTGVGVWLLLSDDGDDQAVRLVPSVGPEGAGAQVFWRF